MNVRTSRFGEIQVNEAQRLRVVGGLLGFWGLTNYVLFQPGELGIFHWLQSEDVPELAFVVCDPRVVLASYHIELSRTELDCISLASADRAEVLVVLTNPHDPATMTANLQGPIIVNRETRLARQVVLADDAYSTRFKVFPEFLRQEKPERRARACQQECA